MEKSWRYLIVIDPSLNSTGWAVYDVEAKPKLLTYGHVYNRHFETGPKAHGKKLNHIEMVLSTLRQNFYPALVVKEEHVNSEGNGYVTALPHAIVAKVFAYTQIIEVNNSNFKREFTGNGRAEKEEVEAEVYKYRTRIWGRKELLFRTDDESDSVGIGIWFLVNNGYLKQL